MDTLKDKKNFICDICPNEIFKTRISTIKHFEQVHFDRKESKCIPCLKSGIRNPVYHSKKHISVLYKCRFCTSTNHFFTSLSKLQKHYTKNHQTPKSSIFSLIDSAFKRRVLTFQTKFSFRKVENLDVLKLNVFDDLKALLYHQLSLKHLMRFSLVVGTEYVKFDELGKVKNEETIYLRSSAKALLLNDLNQNQLGKRVNECLGEINARNESFLLSGSGWSMNQIRFINVELAKMSFAGGCSGIQLKHIKGSKAKYLCNPETERNECFTNCVAISLLSQDIFKKTSKEQGEYAREFTKQHFNIKDLKFPLNLKDIRKFEMKNKQFKMQINVFTLFGGNIIPVHKSLCKSPKNIINLYLHRTSQSSHFFLITNLNKFLQKKNNRFFCSKCLFSFSSSEALQNHSSLCDATDPAKIEYPEEDDPGVRFTAHSKTVLQPFFMVSDFESTLHPISRKENGDKYKCENCKKRGDETNCKHRTFDVNHQVPTTYSIALIDYTGKILFLKTESDYINVMKKFFDTLDYIEKTFFPLLQRFKYKFDYSQAENENFSASEKCYLCNGVFAAHINGRNRVRDHCHYSNKYLGAAHSKCNWMRTLQSKVPVYIHNFQNYDSQFIIQGLKYVKSIDKINAIPYNMEKFRTLEIGKFVFVDSFHLLPASLDVLISNLNSDSTHAYPLLDQVPLFKKNLHLRAELLKKGSYPYEWATSVMKLVRTKRIPKHKHFYSRLTQKNISLEEYKRAQKIFKGFKMDSMLTYTQFYCELDVILLAEVILEFRAMVLSDFNVDATQYISAPQLAHDSMLKQLDEPIQRLTDPDMILMCEQNVRGGVSFVAERHVRCSGLEKEISTIVPNETELQRFNRINSKKTDLLFTLDANNLYSVSQKCLLPHSNYEWCSEKELKVLKKEILNLPDNHDTGFIIEADLIYPKKMHKKHASFPLLPYKRKIMYKDLSPFSKKCLKTLYGETEAKKFESEKLVTDVLDKQKYVLHYRNLKTYLHCGIKLGKIHRAFKFTQKRYLKSFIEKCTEKRKKARTAFGKMFYKLFMNSNYGKFLQNNRKHSDVAICKKYSKFAKLCNSPLYTGHRILHKNVAAVYLRKAKHKLDRLYATGLSILELAKNHMYESWYRYMLPRLGEENANIVLTDTDSLLIHCKNMSRNQFFESIKGCLDLSNYDPSNDRRNTDFAGCPGFFKDENEGNYLTEVIGLKSKCYITKVIDKNLKKK